MALSIAVFLLAVLGVLLIAPKPPASSGKRIRVRETVHAQKRARVVTVKISPYARFKRDMIIAFEQAGLRLSWEKYLIVCVVSSVLGALLGALFDNLPLAAVLAVSLPVTVTQYIKIRSLGYRSFLQMQIESSLGIITNAYIQCEDIRTALENSLPRTDMPLKAILSDCANEIFIGAHATDAIARMRVKVDNRFWREWCDTLIQCQADRSLMVLLPPIIQQLSAVRQIQSEIDAQTADIWRNHVILCLITIGAVPLVRLLNTDWYVMLTTTTVGKIAIAVSYGIVFLSTLYAARVNKPISAEV